MAEIPELNRGLTIREIGSELRSLVDEIRNFDPIQVISTAAALASIADNHTLIYRLDALIYLAAAHGTGQKVPTIAILDRWLNEQIPESQLSVFEDPPEDFAIGLVRTDVGDRLVFNGPLSGPDVYLQDVLDSLGGGPERLAGLRAAASAALSLSNELVNRCGYDRHSEGSFESQQVVLPDSNAELWRLISLQFFSAADIDRLAASETTLSPFVCDLEELRRSALDRKLLSVPTKAFLKLGDLILVLHPTSVCEAIIGHVLNELGRMNMIAGFANALNKGQAGRVFESVSRHLGLESILQVVDGFDPASRPPGISEMVFHFGTDKLLHLVIVHDDMREALREGLDYTWRTTDQLPTHLRNVASIISRRPGISGVLTLLVVGGIGRSYQFSLPVESDRQFLQVWSLFDFERLEWIEPDWEQALWKLSQQESVLARRGLEFNVSDDATLYGHWLSESYNLIPSEVVDSPRVLVGISCSAVLTLRRRWRLLIDSHSAFRPDRNEWYEVCRVNPHGYFKDDEVSGRYGAKDLVSEGFLAGAVLTDQRTWWVDLNVPQGSAVDRNYLYKIWESAQIWMERVATAIEQQVALPPQNFIVTLDVSAVAAIEDLDAATVVEIPVSQEYPVTKNAHGFTVSVPSAFIAMGRSPQNVAELGLARTFVSGGLLLGGNAATALQVDEIVAPLHISPDERHLHTIVADDHRDYLREFSSGEHVLSKDSDMYFAGAEMAYEIGLPVTETITDRGRCNSTLNQVVEAHWLRCKKRLAAIDRRSMVVFCLENNEAILAEQDNWRRTRRAVSALHRDRADMLAASHDALRVMDRTQVSLRAIVEMAICACPSNGGRMVTEEDFDYLSSQIIQMIATAQQSDAMRAEVIPAWLRTSIAGDIRVSSDYSDLMIPYLSSHFETVHRRDVADYENHLQARRRGYKTEEEAFGKSFVSAFREEYGISPIRLAEVSTVLAEEAFELKKNVVVQAKASVKELLARKGFSSDEISGVFHHFVLPNRPEWTEIDSPFRGKDWWPWRYRRALSLMNRPIVALSPDEFAYAPGFCEDSFRHVVMESYSGAFEPQYFSSSSMKQYVGTVNGKNGLDFNKTVASAFSEAGWRVEVEVQMTQLHCPADQASGDIDVVAFKDGVLYVCECKDLSFARTITEVVEQIVRFKGKRGDALWKHMRRFEWAQSNANAFVSLFGSAPTEVRSLLVTSKLAPMQFSGEFPTRVVNMDSLETFLKPNLD